MRSLLGHGHSLALYCYRDIAGIPHGVETRDAATILPESSFFHHRNGSPAPFADWFRYALQRQQAGTWVDLDLYFVAKLDDVGGYLFGLQEPAMINNAILRVPAESPLLRELLAIFENSGPLPWLSLRETVEDRWTRLFAPRKRRERLPWGATGPRALNALATKLSVSDLALPVEVFYPVPWQKAHWIANPLLQLENVIAPETVAIHLWNECIADLKSRRVPIVARYGREGLFDPNMLESMNMMFTEKAEFPSGGAIGTAGDLFRFTEMLRRGGELDGVRLLSPRILSEALTNHTGDLPNDIFDYAREMRGWPDYPAYIGLTFFLRGEGLFPTPMGHLSSPGTYSGQGAGSTLFWVDPERDLTFICLTAGVMEDSDSILRFQRLSDLVVSAVRD